MAVLLNSGVCITRAIEICQQQSPNKKLQEASLVMLKELGFGQRLSQAMALCGPPFEEIHGGAVAVGEINGDLSLVLLRLADHSEESARIKRRLIAALAYPALVVGISAIGLYLLIRFLAPILAEVGLQLQGKPNLVSRGMLFLGQVFEREFLTLSALALFGVAAHRLGKSLWSRYPKRLEKLLFRIPLVGKMLRLGVLIRICQTLETMIGGGLALTQSFLLTAKTCGSRYYAEDILVPSVERIHRGESLSQALRGSPGLPNTFLGLVIAGEESGRLDESFRYLSRLYEMELVNAVEAFLNALEPLSIATVGLVVLGVLLSVFAPLSKLLTAV